MHTLHTQVIAQYKTMRETVVYLTNLNYEDTEAIMLEKLDLQVWKTIALSCLRCVKLCFERLLCVAPSEVKLLERTKMCISFVLPRLRCSVFTNLDIHSALYT